MSLSKIWQLRRIFKSDIQNLDYSYLPKEITKPRQIVWHLMNKIDKIPICQNKQCQNNVNWVRNKYNKFCSHKCSANSNKTQQKRKQTCLNRYGVENPFQSEEIKEQIKQLNLERYGVNHHMKIKEIQAKKNHTNLERYGVEYPMQSPEIEKKTKQTNLERYGVEYVFQAEDVKKKYKQNMLDRYGVENPFQLKEIKEKIKQTCMKKYGSERYMDSPYLKNKLQKEEKIQFINQKHYSTLAKEILLDKDKFNEFIEDKAIMQVANLLNVNYETIRRYISLYQTTKFVKRSYLENEMKAILEEIGINFIQNTRKIIAPLELDFYLPDHQVAIEMNGDYWHSDKFLTERYGLTADEYHQIKTDRCREKGIELIHISESEWNSM